MTSIRLPLPSRLLAAIAAIGLLVASAVVQVAPVGAATGQVLYGSNGAAGNKGDLLILDPETGAVLDTVGAIGYAITGLAVHPTTGVLYGVTGSADADAPRSLVTIDKATGAGTVIGALNVGGPAADITFGADGTLYGWSEGTDDLVTIDLSTGTATIVGDAGISTYGSGLAGSGNPLTLAGQGASGCLLQIDTSTGASSCPVTLDGTDTNSVAAAAFDAAGRLYASHALTGGGGGAYELVTIDPSTGAMTVIGATSNNLDAIAFDTAQPLTAAKVADAGTSAPGGTNGYTITISNPNLAAATVETISDTLPAGFAYVAGSTTGATTNNPSIAGSTLTWAGPFTAPAGGSVSISFDVTVSTVPGTYQNQAGGTAEGNTVTGTGPTAAIVVTGSTSSSPSPSPSATAPVTQLPNTSASPLEAQVPLVIGLAALLLLAIGAVARMRRARI